MTSRRGKTAVKSVCRTMSLAVAFFVPTLLFAQIARSATPRPPVPDTASSKPCVGGFSC